MSERPQFIAHIDVNSAYLSWTAMDHLRRGGKIDYRTVPAIVGGDPKTRHGIVLAKSIPAKKFGVQTAELVWQACKKCPGLIVLPGDYRLYTECSKAMMSIIREYSDRVYVYSIDEAFIDLTGMQKLFGDPIELVDTIRERIRDELGFTVSIGISSNMLLAKMGSDMRKPDATTTLFPHEIQKKMWPLPIEDLFMCGRATTEKLKRLGIYTIGSLAGANPTVIQGHLKSHGAMLWNYANGISSGIQSSFKAHDVPRGIGNSTVTRNDVTSKEVALLYLLSLSESVAMRMRAENLGGSVVSIAVRDTEFTGRQMQKKMDAEIRTTNDIYNVAQYLLEKLWYEGEPLRHFGVRCSGLHKRTDYQYSLLQNVDRAEDAEEAVFRIRQRYGNSSIMRASFLHGKVKPIVGSAYYDDEEEIPIFAQGLQMR